MFDVFISYKSEERLEALHIKNFLQANGLECWMDQSQIQIGQDYERQISKVMPECRSLVLLISYASQNSKEVKLEYELAQKNNLQIFPVKIEDCKLSDYYDSKMRHTQIAKEFWKSEQEKQKILCSIVKSRFRCKLPLGAPGCCQGNA